AKKALQNPSSQVASLAAEYFLKNSGPNDEKDLQQILNEGKLPWNSKSQIYASLIKLIPIHKPLKREVLFTHLLADINNSKSAYEKSAYIIALQNSPSYLSFLLQLGQKEKDPYTLTTLTQTIAHIYKNPTFPLLYKGSLNPIYNKTNFFLAKACQNYDVGSLAIISEWFRTEKGLIRKYFKPDSSLRLAQKGLKLPRDIETYNEIENTLSVLNNKKFRSKSIEYNHPIQWKRLTNIHDTIHAEIICTKGKIEIELYPKLVPGSVTNFLELVDQNFFNGKIIHRVVPNFVIQVGCPRGDGYGSLDYSIRTESNTTLNYQKEGMIGMASAGLDTECSQFFITFSPTPHLDGKYTIFGKMTKGMDVMMLIEQGDKILKINLME
ncbi:MAG: peptidylprolyl isomerase, partial [Saprospiraceae bacterium]